MADSEKDRAMFHQWITSPAAGYFRRNLDGSRYDWAAEEQKRNQEPAAWLAFATDGSESSAVYLMREQAEAAADEWGWSIAPLYVQPSLAEDEIDAIEHGLERLELHSDSECQQSAATLHWLLARLGDGE